MAKMVEIFGDDFGAGSGEKDVQATRAWNASGFKYRRQVKKRMLAQLGIGRGRKGLEVTLETWDKLGADVLWDIMLVVVDNLIEDFDLSRQRLLVGAVGAGKAQDAREKEWKYGPGLERDLWVECRTRLQGLADDSTAVDLALVWLETVEKIEEAVSPVHGAGAGKKGWEAVKEVGVLTKKGKGTGAKRTKK